MKTSIYETITNQIVAAIEEGAGLYKMPWHRSRQDITNPQNVVTGRSYRGLNIVTLWMIAEAKGFNSGTWATYQQWQEKGAQVRKGEKAASVFFWKNLREGQEEARGTEEHSPAKFVARAYSVFNADQVEGYEAPVVPALSEDERIARAEAFFSAVPAIIQHEGNQACYIPSRDVVRMVPFAQFKSAGGYYSVLGHELTHWSGAKTRLDRDLSGRFGSESYAVEELIAELGAAFLCGRLGLPNDPRTENAPYIASWLKVLKSDARAIFTAATKAQAAADFLAGFSAPTEVE
ncbi:antirestriction protein ArdC [Caulobacter ginsengisoli]|uniref:Antirestriction protein ArdC n=1 Tax=Caulobacter ginsengisoli TaxID=400775 RepID=A0ABU0IX04_9CAUL|nr:zincin-like metallopeptidase domain-containing protein [Caulobacter ginsengisoli]MDQ0465584.1 antirestriction protein ArdC [Caulobacter ginsengisoli]